MATARPHRARALSSQGWKRATRHNVSAGAEAVFPIVRCHPIQHPMPLTRGARRAPTIAAMPSNRGAVVPHAQIGLAVFGSRSCSRAELLSGARSVGARRLPSSTIRTTLGPGQPAQRTTATKCFGHGRANFAMRYACGSYRFKKLLGCRDSICPSQPRHPMPWLGLIDLSCLQNYLLVDMRP